MDTNIGTKMYIHTLYLLLFTSTVVVAIAVVLQLDWMTRLDWIGFSYLFLGTCRTLSLNFTPPPPPLLSAASRGRFETPSIQLPFKRSERINHRQTNAQVLEKFPPKKTTRLKQWQQPQQAPSSPPGTPATKPTPYSFSSAQSSAGPSFPPYVPPKKIPPSKKSNPPKRSE